MKYQRKEVIGDCVLYLGDNMEIMPHLTDIGAVITDPPYGISVQNKNGKIGATSKDIKRWNGQINTVYPIFHGDDKPIDPTHIINAADCHVIWGGNYIADKLPPTKGWFIWNKRVKGQTNNFADCELAWTSIDTPARVFNHLWMGMLRDSESQEHYHATQKPVALMKWCIEQLPPYEGYILDCYMGSGTTGVACAKMGRKFIGIEIEPKYFDIACRRIEEAYKQPDMFIEPPTKPVQDAML